MARQPQRRQQQAAQQHTGGTPGPRQFIIFDNMPRMNTRPMRQNLREQEAYWIENLQPIAGNDLKIVPAPIFPLMTVDSKTVARQFPTALLSDPNNPNAPLIDYIIYFATDGSGTAIRADNGNSVEFAPPGTFSTTPDMTTFSNQQILIADPIAGYCTWDTIAFSQGINGIPCTTVAVFGGRVWLAHRRNLTWSGTTGDPTDFDPANASGDTTITDADLVHEITALRSLNNYLYIFGDQSTKFIGNITVANPPTGTVGVSTTEFQIVTLSSDVGCPFPMSILSYNRLVMFMNIHGVYAIIGASVQKASDDLDGIFPRLDFGQEPCAALADINNIHCYLLLLRYRDPSNFRVFGVQPQGAPLERSIIAVFQTKVWFLLNQGMNLVSIVSLALSETNDIQVYGSSGSDITPLLVDDNGEVTYILKTPLSAHGNIILNRRAIRAGIALFASLPQSMTFLVESEHQTNEYTIKAARPIVWRNAHHDIFNFFVGPTTPAAAPALPPPLARQNPVSIFGGQVPAQFNQAVPQNYGLTFSSSVPGNVIGVSVYRFPADTVGGTAGLWSDAGSNLATTSFPGGGGWFNAIFNVPVPIAAGTSYVVSYLNSSGAHYYTEDAIPVTGGPLTASLGNDSALHTFAFPAAFTHPHRWWGVDLLFDPNAPPPVPPGPPTPPVPPESGEIHFMIGPGFTVPYLSVDSYGHVLGGTVFSTSSNMSINAVLFEYIDADLWSEHVGSMRPA